MTRRSVRSSLTAMWPSFRSGQQRKVPETAPGQELSKNGQGRCYTPCCILMTTDEVIRYRIERTGTSSSSLTTTIYHLLPRRFSQEQEAVGLCQRFNPRPKVAGDWALALLEAQRWIDLEAPPMSIDLDRKSRSTDIHGCWQSLGFIPFFWYCIYPFHHATHQSMLIVYCTTMPEFM